MRSLDLLVAVTLMACDRPGSMANALHEVSTVPDSGAADRQRGNDVTDRLSGSWDLTLDEGTRFLRVHYTVRNVSAGRVYVSDELLRSGGRWLVPAGDVIVVVNATEPGSVRFVRAAIGTDRPLAVLYPTTYVALAPGETLERSARAPWPLVAWHNLGWVRPLQSPPLRAYLELHFFSGEPPSWRDLPGQGGTSIRVPEGFDPERFVLGPLGLPSS